jgi:cell division protease FtsH
MAEQLIFNEVTTGAQDDLSKATLIAHKVVCEYGMSERLGPITYRKKSEELFLGRELGEGQNYSDQTAQMIDEEVKRLIADAQARQNDSDRQPAALETLAKTLVEKEVLKRRNQRHCRWPSSLGARPLRFPPSFATRNGESF